MALRRSMNDTRILILFQFLSLSLHIHLTSLAIFWFNVLIYFWHNWLPTSCSLVSQQPRRPPPGVPYCSCATDEPGPPSAVFGSPITIHIISTKRLIGSGRNKGVCLLRQPPTMRPWAEARGRCVNLH